MNLVLFDMDHTIVPADTGCVWSQFLYEKGLVTSEQVKMRKRYLKEYQDGTLVLQEAYSYEIDILLKLDDRKDMLIQEFFAIKIKPLITTKAIQAVQQHRENGDYLVMITATLSDLAVPVANFFGFNHCIASVAERDNLNNYTGNLVLGPCMGEGKLVHLNKWLDDIGYPPQNQIFYSDSHNDLPLLFASNTAIAVDPDDQLRAIAQQKNWQIISFLDS